MPSDVPNERLHDIITNIDRARAHLKGMTPGSELDDKTRDAVEQELGPLRQACVNDLAVRQEDEGAR
ncbi:MAG: hypothetical protein Q7S20_00260 [Gemmatimonadaceae bacterium]|nr:hypothetical protein [Gemmatimonadaceae bacterium]